MQDSDFNKAARFNSQLLRWSAQPLINFLSRFGLIPTYSFPVNNIQLEVISKSLTGSNDSHKNPWEQDIVLDRDARLAITEYAPGAEVIAGGKVWASRAIGYYPKHFMAEKFYKICDECQHIEVAFEVEALGSECPSCSAELKGFPQRYMEPRSFTTSYDEKPKLPGQTRRKPPRSMDATLLTSAPEKDFKYKMVDESGRMGWAVQKSGHASMLIINKGKGQGYKRCGCGFTEAIKGRNISFPNHKQPKTGYECKGSTKLPSIHLAHEFNTDVLQLRIENPLLPHCDELCDIDQLAYTISEACRLAIVTALQIGDNEIGSCVRWHLGNQLELVFYDSVSGGAGYVNYFVEKSCNQDPLNFMKLVKPILDCEHCQDGCSHCLYYFSNQFHWDNLKRTNAVQFIDALVGTAKSQSQNYPDAWMQVSNDRVSEALDSASTISIYCDSLGDFSGERAEIANEDTGEIMKFDEQFPFIRTLDLWTANGKTVNIYTKHLPVFESEEQNTPKAWLLAEFLLPKVRSGQLNISKIQNISSINPLNTPRVWLDDKEFYQPESGIPNLFESKYPLVEGDMSYENSQAATKLEEKTEKKLSVGDFEKPRIVEKKFYHRSYSPIEERRTAEDFQFVKTEKIKSIQLYDPFILSDDSHVDAVLALFELVLGLGMNKDPERLKLHYKEDYNPSVKKEQITAANSLKVSLVKLLPNTDVKIEGVRKTTYKDFHDRYIVFEASVPEVPKEKKVVKKKSSKKNNSARKPSKRLVVELSSGIHGYMNPNRKNECRIYRLF